MCSGEATSFHINLLSFKLHLILALDFETIFHNLNEEAWFLTKNDKINLAQWAQLNIYLDYAVYEDSFQAFGAPAAPAQQANFLGFSWTYSAIDS